MLLVQSDDDRLAARKLLRDGHASLMRLFDDVLHRFVEDDRDETRRAWSLFDAALRVHMDAEERLLFGDLWMRHPAEYERLTEDHAFFTKALDTLGIAVDLHTFRVDAARELVAKLEAHEAREDEYLYAWESEPLDDDAPERAEHR